MSMDIKDEIKSAIDKVFEGHEHTAFTKLRHELLLYAPHPNAIIVHPVFMDQLIKENNHQIVKSACTRGYCYMDRDRKVPIYVSSDNLDHDDIKIL